MFAQAHDTFEASSLERSARTPVQARAIVPDDSADAPIRFLAPDADTALAWRPYRLQIGTRLLLGRTDEQGCTAPLCASDRAALLHWEIE